MYIQQLHINHSEKEINLKNINHLLKTIWTFTQCLSENRRSRAGECQEQSPPVYSWIRFSKGSGKASFSAHHQLAIRRNHLWEECTRHYLYVNMIIAFCSHPQPPYQKPNREPKHIPHQLQDN